ncbi:MAG: HAD-IA family hydrolase [Planctomycetota bacterium]|jgi:putative hydrolase of the HAD superfamily
MTKDVHTVFFDAGDTLIHVRAPLHELYTKVINEHKNPSFEESAVKRAMAVQLERTSLISDGHYRYSDGWFELYIQGMLETLACPKPWNGIRDGLFALFDDPSSFQVFPDVLPCLEKVRARGLKTAVVSNWGYRLPELFGKLGLTEFFDTIIASADVEVEKPDPSIFKHALKRTNSVPEHTMHIGDSLEADIMGARSAGIAGVLLDRHDQEPENTDKVGSLWEITKFLDGEITRKPM